MKKVFEELLFPFGEVRPVQDQMLLKVDQVISKGRNLIMHAPTGVGKTVGTVSPALKHAIDKNLTVFFLTPKHSQHMIAIDTLKRIKEKYQVQFAVTDLIGKKWMCPVPGIDTLSHQDFRDYCKSVRDNRKCEFYRNARTKSLALRESASKVIKKLKEKPLHVEELCNVCKREKLCPYEIATNLAKESRIIVCDYYHVFHPQVREAFFLKSKKSLDSSILIVDEGQNLPNRTRSLLSSYLSNISLARAAKESKTFGFSDTEGDIRETLEVLNQLVKGKLRKKKEVYLKKEDFQEPVETRIGKFERLIQKLKDIADQVREKKKRSYCGGLASFLEDWLGEDEGYARILRKGKTKKGNRYIRLSYKCLDPTLATQEPISRSSSAILMSGTLTPTEMYQDLLGFEKAKTDTIEYKSPFPKENRLVLVVPGVTSLYDRRGKEEYKKMATYINKVTKLVPGRCAAFFCSYQVMFGVLKFLRWSSKRKLIIQKPGMSKKVRTKLYQKFLQTEKGMLLGPQGGSFSEGLDLGANKLDCVIVVGLALERPDLETLALINYYDQKYGQGWNYGYLFPAVARAIQASGRCIRSEEDKGVIVLMDKRFLWKNYSKCFPKSMDFKVTLMPGEQIKNFWKEKEKS